MRPPWRGWSRPWRWATAAGALSLAAGGVWALATPPFMVPDEPAHGLKAVALWNGELIGEPTGRGGETIVDVPRPWERAGQVSDCTAFLPEVTPASCPVSFGGRGPELPVPTTAGKYPPLYYAVVGWAWYPLGGTAGLYAMRLVSVAMVAALVALAAGVSARVARTRLPLFGVAAAVTPMTLNLAGSVNPNGVEIAAAIALFASTVVAVHDPAPPGVRAALVRHAPLVVSGVVLAFSRTLSPAFTVAVIGAVGLFAFGLRPRAWLRGIRTRRDLWAPVGLVGLAVVLAWAFIAAAGTLEGEVSGGTSSDDGVWRVGLGFTETAVRQMVGVFGWLDTGASTVALAAWLAVISLLVGLALLYAPLRQVGAVGIVTLVVLLLPVLANLGSYETSGFVWQGRYGLPLAVGIPILAAWALDGAPRPPHLAGRRAAVVLTAPLAVGHVHAVYWATRRFAVGRSGDPWFFVTGSLWSPPVSAVVLLATMAATGTVAVVLSIPRGDQPMRIGAEA